MYSTSKIDIEIHLAVTSNTEYPKHINVLICFSGKHAYLKRPPRNLK